MPIITTDQEIRPLLRRARTIAVVGYSDHQWRDSYRIAHYLQDAGYTVVPVNPLLPSLPGRTSYARVAEIPFPVDIVDIFRRPEHVPGVVEDAIAAGAHAVWMQLGVAHAAAAERASAAGLAVVTERCIMVEHRRLTS